MRRRSRIQKGKVGNRCTEQGISDWNTGKIFTMPGLPEVPSAEKIGLDDYENIVGLF